MADINKPKPVPVVVKSEPTAEDEFQFSELVGSEEQTTTVDGELDSTGCAAVPIIELTAAHSACERRRHPVLLEPWLIGGAAGNMILFVEHGSTPNELQEWWPTIDLGEIEELSDFLRTVKEDLDAAEADAEAGVADACPPKQKLRLQR